MSRAPAPLVPADVDLSGFEYMPLNIDRLRQSKTWLYCKRRPTIAFSLFNLWMHAFKNRPAGSVENDDDVLADAAGVPLDDWPKIKADLMKSWQLCSDGRYYHPYLCEVVLECWSKRVAFRDRTKAARDRRQLLRHIRGDAVTDSVTDNVTTNVTTLKEGKERKKERNTQKNTALSRSNGKSHHAHPREASLDLLTAIRTGTEPTDQATRQIVTELGGFDHLRTKTDHALADLLKDFESRYKTVTGQ